MLTFSSMLNKCCIGEGTSQTKWGTFSKLHHLKNNVHVLTSLRWRYTVTRLMIFIAVANVLAITTNYSPKIWFCINKILLICQWYSEGGSKSKISTSVAETDLHFKTTFLRAARRVFATKSFGCF